jgi:hypothetical protein
VERRPTTQDISWLLDLDRNGQLDLEPPYQRRSVWTPKDRRFFLDTIFRNYPSPAIFLHKHISDTGAVKYFVVDGKQRLETILRFSKGKLRIGEDYGDERLNGKRFQDISDNMELKLQFWNYQIPVEMIDFRESAVVKNVFDRLNRNSRKLTSQELRHAKFDGWFINKAESEADLDVWKELGVATRARATRMVDVQFISELMALVINNGPRGFSQYDLDEIYALYDDPLEVEDFDLENFNERFERAKGLMVEMERHNHSVSRVAKTSTAIYTLWGLLVEIGSVNDVKSFADRYAKFIGDVEAYSEDIRADFSDDVISYRENSRGASTEPSQRIARQDALRAALGQ